MGDRCYCVVMLAKGEASRLIGDHDDTTVGKFLGNEGFVEQEHGEWVDEQANYGAPDVLSFLAGLGIRFHGWHGNGGDYPGAVFCGREGGLHEWSCWDGCLGEPVIRARSPESAAELLAEYWKFREAVEEATSLVDKSWAGTDGREAKT